MAFKTGLLLDMRLLISYMSMQDIIYHNHVIINMAEFNTLKFQIDKSL